MTWREVVYEYDGSFDGLLCCIYESYTQKELPAAFFRTGELEPCLYEVRAVTTDAAHARRVYEGFRRFSPEVGPFLRRAYWTCLRYHNETFFLYDRTHREALFYADGHSAIVSLEEFVMAPPDEAEKRYRRLWRCFYDTIAIRERENPKLRMSHMPKRFWPLLTELQSDPDAIPPSPSPCAAFAAPDAPAAIPAPATRQAPAPSAPASAP